MNSDWNAAFHFTQRERRGIFILAAMLIVLLILPYILSYCHTPSKIDFSEFKQDIAAFEAERSVIEIPPTNAPFTFNPNTITKKALIELGIAAPIAQRIINYRNAGGTFRYKKDLQKIYGFDTQLYKNLEAYILLPSKKKKVLAVKEIKTPKTIQAFRFDPNQVSLQELQKMNLPTKTAQQIINYRNKGGVFKKKQDLQKIYTLTDDAYKKLAPYILIKNPDTPPKQFDKSKKQTRKTPTNISVDINKASLEEWQQLKGIGPYYAKKIIRFREVLGGYASIEQIGTAYGLPDSVFQKIRNQLVASPISNLLAINRLSIDRLKEHPYLNARQAVAIVNYRKNHGLFQSIEDVKKVRVLSDVELLNLQPYLTFD